MITLGLDTSTPAGSVALLQDGGILGEINLTTGGHHQQRLLRSIDLLLDLAALEIAQVDLLAVALGPGTFTGLRVGIATAKGLALSRGIPVYGVSTLRAMGQRYIACGLPVAPLIDAGRKEVYASLYRNDSGRLQEALPERAGSPEEILASLEAEPILFCGDGVRICKDLILGSRSNRDRLVEEPVFLGATLAGIGTRKFEEGFPWSIGSLRPNYIRPPDAEVARRR
jgi:tRNA threonylcarbamoyladenosine biosynthesis protein TsaB